MGDPGSSLVPLRPFGRLAATPRLLTNIDARLRGWEDVGGTPKPAGGTPTLPRAHRSPGAWVLAKLGRLDLLVTPAAKPSTLFLCS